ncbi:MAG: hypothetical protein V9E84_02660 [Trichococcus flocculiformis]
MNIYNLKTNYLMNPIGFLMDTVALSWIIEAPFEEELQGTRVLIALDENFEEVIHDSRNASRFGSAVLSAGNQAAAAHALLLESDCEEC